MPFSSVAPPRPVGTLSSLADIRVLMPMQGPLTLQGQAVTVELPPGRALTLRVQKSGVLRVRSGRVWLTLTLRQGSAAQRSDDYFLEGASQWAMDAGQSGVIEPFAAGDLPITAQLDWQPAPCWTSQWQAALRQVLRPLQALG